MGRECRHLLQQFRAWRSDEVDLLDFVAIAKQCRALREQPVVVDSRDIRDHRDRFGIRMEPKRQVDDFRNTERGFDTRHSRPHLLRQRRADRHEDDGDAWKHRVAVSHRKLERRGHHGNDEIQLLVGVATAKRFGEVFLVGLLFEPRVLEIDNREVHGARKPSPQRRLHLIDRDAATPARQYQDVLGLRLGRGRRGQSKEDEYERDSCERSHRDFGTSAKSVHVRLSKTAAASRACHAAAVCGFAENKSNRLTEWFTVAGGS